MKNMTSGWLFCPLEVRLCIDIMYVDLTRIKNVLKLYLAKKNAKTKAKTMCVLPARYRFTWQLIYIRYNCLFAENKRYYIIIILRHRSVDGNLCWGANRVSVIR
jgi:hypothetical protein